MMLFLNNVIFVTFLVSSLFLLYILCIQINWIKHVNYAGAIKIILSILFRFFFVFFFLSTLYSMKTKSMVLYNLNYVVCITYLGMQKEIVLLCFCRLYLFTFCKIFLWRIATNGFLLFITLFNVSSVNSIKLFCFVWQYSIWAKCVN